jgi:hypothetical protein
MEVTFRKSAQSRPSYSAARICFVDAHDGNSVAVAAIKAQPSHLTNCFFGRALDQAREKGFMILAAGSQISLKNSVAYLPGIFMGVTDGANVTVQNCIIESMWGFDCEKSTINLKQVKMYGYANLEIRNHCKVSATDCQFEDFPDHFVKLVPDKPKALMSVESDSELTIKDSTMQHQRSIISVTIYAKDKAVVNIDNCKLTQTLLAIGMHGHSQLRLTKSRFSFKKRSIDRVIMVDLNDKATSFFSKNTVTNREKLVAQNVRITEVAMDKDGIPPATDGELSVEEHVFNTYEESTRSGFGLVLAGRKQSASGHSSVHFDRMGKGGGGVSKGGKRMCHCCSKTEKPDEVTFKYCSNCKYVSYCSKECQEKDWKQGHKTSCVPYKFTVVP